MIAQVKWAGLHWEKRGSNPLSNLWLEPPCMTCMVGMSSTLILKLPAVELHNDHATGLQKIDSRVFTIILLLYYVANYFNTIIPCTYLDACGNWLNHTLNQLLSLLLRCGCVGQWCLIHHNGSVVNWPLCVLLPNGKKLKKYSKCTYFFSFLCFYMFVQKCALQHRAHNGQSFSSLKLSS